MSYRYHIRVLLLGSLLGLLSACSITHATRVADHQSITIDAMVSEIGETRVVLVGESHDAAVHHRLQLEVLKKLKAQGRTLAIGMEMFETSSQRALDAWSAGKVPEEAFRKLFEYNWRNLPWELYEEILLFARDNRIPVIGLNATREVVQKVARQGGGSLSEDDLRRLPPGIELEMSETYVEFMRGAYTSHGKTGEEFRNICAAQLLRNRVMARKIRDYLLLRPEVTMVVLAGGGHARERGGIPPELGDLPHRVILPYVPGLDARSVTSQDGDYLLEEPSWLPAVPWSRP
jgi:uncharacterized iron-regulated protein